MANVLVEEASLSAIADAIRAKNGTDTTYKPSEMADAITAIEGGGSGSGAWDAVLYKGATEVTDTKATAFYGIHGVTSVDLPVCTSIGSYAFYNCTSLTSVDLPVCTSIGSYAFYNCTKLTSVDLPVCTTIGNSAFYRCSTLTSVDLPVCTSIGSYAFYSCSSLTSVDLPVCTTIGNSAFNRCSTLTSVDLPVCTTIGNSAFYSCSSLTSVDLPVCTTIGNSAFYSCSSLTSVDLPVCTTIGNSAFYSCSSLTSLYLRSPTICKSVGSQSFSNSALKIYVPEALLDEYKAAFYWSSWASRFASLEEYEASTANAISLEGDGISTLELEDTQISVDELIAAAENDLKTAQTLGDPTDYIEERLKELYAERDGASVDDGTASVDDDTVARPAAD